MQSAWFTTCWSGLQWNIVIVPSSWSKRYTRLPHCISFRKSFSMLSWRCGETSITTGKIQWLGRFTLWLRASFAPLPVIQVGNEGVVVGKGGICRDKCCFRSNSDSMSPKMQRWNRAEKLDVNERVQERSSFDSWKQSNVFNQWLSD